MSSPEDLIPESPKERLAKYGADPLPIQELLSVLLFLGAKKKRRLRLLLLLHFSSIKRRELPHINSPVFYENTLSMLSEGEVQILTHSGYSLSITREEQGRIPAPAVIGLKSQIPR